MMCSSQPWSTNVSERQRTSAPDRVRNGMGFTDAKARLTIAPVNRTGFRWCSLTFIDVKRNVGT
jgi:hypothetical protein